LPERGWTSKNATGFERLRRPTASRVGPFRRLKCWSFSGPPEGRIPIPAAPALLAGAHRLHPAAHMNTLVCALLLLLLVPQKIGDVESSYDKRADFAALKTYAWARGHEALTPVVHKSIAAAIDAQMASLGFTKADAATADTILKYHVVRGTDVDLKALEKAPPAAGPAPTKTLGKLVVVLYPKGSTETPLWQANTRQYVSDDAATREEELQRTVTALFATYPGRTPRKTGGQS
jgi:Domain of unknown function (DUF4136)